MSRGIAVLQEDRRHQLAGIDIALGLAFGLEADKAAGQVHRQARGAGEHCMAGVASSCSLSDSSVTSLPEHG